MLKSLGYFQSLHLYDTCAIKPSGPGLGSDCVQMQTYAEASNTVIAMEVQVAHTLAVRPPGCGCVLVRLPATREILLHVTTFVVSAVTIPKVQ